MRCGSATACPAAGRGTTTLQVFVVLALIVVGWALARDLVRGVEPILFRRMDKATAGTAGFVIRLATVVAAIVVALRIAGAPIAAIAIGASFSAVVFGLAAQQTLGNLIAGIVLLSARPFRVGDRVRLQGGGIGGRIEGVVSSLGLLYTTFNAGDDPVLVPNSLVLSVSVSPLREPEAVSLRAPLRPGGTPVELQRVIEEGLTVPIRRHPDVTLEEIDGERVIVTISATPRLAADGGRLASELLDAVTSEINETAEDGSGRGRRSARRAGRRPRAASAARARCGSRRRGRAAALAPSGVSPTSCGAIVRNSSSISASAASAPLSAGPPSQTISATPWRVRAAPRAPRATSAART